MSLKKISIDAQKEITDKFLEGEVELDLEEHIDDIDRKTSIEDFKSAVDEVIKEYENNEEMSRQDMDALLAPKIHQSLDLTPREASNTKIWNYLSLEIRPDYVRKRWKSKNEDRFWADTKLTRHAFATLWWVAEMTKKEGAENPYELTEKTFNQQDVFQQIIDKDFSRHRPLAQAFASIMYNEDSRTIQRVGVEILNDSSTTSIDMLDFEDSRKFVKQKLDEVQGKEGENKEKSKRSWRDYSPFN
jgi:hypothetical protein